MKLLRVQVPNFRALKDVDISFEPDFVPNIFPIGSQNGGGKSTLLQLIFILLHCSHHPDRQSYIKNLLQTFEEVSFYDDFSILKISLQFGRKIFNLDFFCRYENSHDMQDILHDETCHITSHYAIGPDLKAFYLICQISENLNQQNFYLKRKEIRQVLAECSEKIFLVMPETPIFLFSDRNLNRQLLHNTTSPHLSEQILEDQRKLPGLFTYNFVATDSLIDVFKKARDLDFQKAIETGGEYGKSYESLLGEFNQFLGGVKQVNVISANLDEITFYKTENGRRIALYPEDLSRGEMKRLSLYVWLKQQQIHDAVVLIDEVETALHPDWQYQIVSDLATWGPTNQYLLATHSYELCQALTPAHVKEIPPVLLKQPVANP
jgi:ABC-type dipeptide/oligopeptide/nickel transport system ATPase component